MPDDDGPNPASRIGTTVAISLNLNPIHAGLGTNINSMLILELNPDF